MAAINDLSKQQFYHGTKADLKLGDLIESIGILPGGRFRKSSVASNANVISTVTAALFSRKCR